ncbi:MAG: HAMP domain-containing protein [Elusimicrobia bacterium]|nr:HAMP domain-containing protein [Elusimicrobiota bacterium]
MLAFRSGLFKKFFLVMGALALVPAVYLAYRLSTVSQRGIQSAVLELQTKLAEKMAERVDGYFRFNEDKLNFAFMALQKNLEWKDKQELLRSLIDTHTDIIEISVLNPAGKEVIKVYNPDLSTDEALRSRAEESGFRRFMKERQHTVAISAKDETLEAYYPLGGGGERGAFTVIVRVLVSLATLSSAVASERVGGTGFAVLVDGQGAPLFYPKDKLDAAAAAGVGGWSITGEALKAHSVGSAEFSLAGRSSVGAYAPVASVGGAVLIVQPYDEAYWAALQMKRMTRVALVIVAVGALLAAMLLAKNLTSPLLSLSRAADQVSHGDFSARVDVKTGDELQDLADTFNRMTDKLRQYAEMQVDKIVAEQRKTEAILFSISDGILMTDPEGKVRLANRRALEFFGLDSKTSLDGKTPEEAVPVPKLKDAILAVLAEPKPEVYKEVNLSTDKHHKYLRVTALPLLSPSTGKTLGVVAAMRDVTLEKEIEKMKEEFLHYITHDLRNPLGSAMGFIEVLLKGLVGNLSPEQHNMISSIQRSMSRLMAMVNNILDIAKMESGRMKVSLSSVNLGTVAARSISILESLSKQKKITVVFEAAGDYSVDADPDMVERVYTNLLGNAIKFTPSEGKITLSAADEGDRIKCGVSDTGDGVPESYRDKIFEKFEQVAGQKRGGTGLGLTITKYFVEAHRGRVWVESEVGKGSQFYFTIPKGLKTDAKGDVFIEGAAA